MLLLGALLALAFAERTWPVRDVPTLLQVLEQANSGDIVELEPGDYVFTTSDSINAPILIDKPLTLRSRDTRQRAVLHNDGGSLLIAVTSPFVTISDVVVGAQRTGGAKRSIDALGDERSIDVLVGAGTQTRSSALSYNALADERKRSLLLMSPAELANAKRQGLLNLAPSRREISVARALHMAPDAKRALRKRAAEVREAGDMRALHDIRIENVDFTASRSGTNVAFARGSYSMVTITHSSFGRIGSPNINAIVAVADAQFVSLNAHHNSIAGGAHVLVASLTVETSAFDLNFWAGKPHLHIGGEQQAPTTYCLDILCEKLGPVVDGDKPTQVYESLKLAVIAGVHNILITDDIELREPIVISTKRTRLSSTASCSGTPLLTIRTGGAIVSAGGALESINNVRIALAGSAAVGFVFTDGSAQRLSVARFATELLNVNLDPLHEPALSLVLFDGVSILGDSSTDQVAIILNAPKVRIEIEDFVVVQAQYGAVVHRGAFVSVDSSFFASGASALYVETVTHQTALRVSGSAFIANEIAAIELGAGASSSTLREFSITCSQFLFNKNRMPILAHDCAKKPTLCAAALRWNTVITDQVAAGATRAELTSGESRMWKMGANHIEHGRNRDDFVHFGDPTVAFTLKDSNGRFDWVSGALSGDAARGAFLLATYAPLRGECFGTQNLASDATVVSDTLEVRSDSLLHGCSTLATRFRVADASKLPENLGVYGVANLGDQSEWTRAVALTHSDGDTPAIEATIAVHNVEDDLHTHRLVVVALEHLPESIRFAIASGTALVKDVPRSITKRLCVQCGAQNIPAPLLDEFCGASTENVRTSFDDAYDELGFGKIDGPPRDSNEGVSLFLFGACTTSKCSVVIGHAENIEGAPSARGKLSRAPVDPCDRTKAALVQFNARASQHSSISNIDLDAATIDDEIAIQVLSPLTPSSNAPAISFNTIGGAVVLNGRGCGIFINNDQSVRTGQCVYINDDITRANKSYVIEANNFAGCGISVSGNSTVRIDRNEFSGVAVVNATNGASLFVTVNKGLTGVINQDGTPTRIEALGNELARNADVVLRGGDSYVGTGINDTDSGTRTYAVFNDARLASIYVNSSSNVTVDAVSSVTLRDVRFEDVGASLVTAPKFESCTDFEITVAGINTLRSLIWNVDNQLVLTPGDKSQIKLGGVAFWARDAHASLAQCSDGLAPIRSEAFCGCAADQVATPEPSPSASPASLQKKQLGRIAKDKKPAAAAIVTATTTTSSSQTLIIVLGLLGGLVIVCLIIACVYAYSRASNVSTALSGVRAPTMVAPTSDVTSYHQALHDTIVKPYQLYQRRGVTAVDN